MIELEFKDLYKIQTAFVELDSNKDALKESTMSEEAKKCFMWLYNHGVEATPESALEDLDLVEETAELYNTLKGMEDECGAMDAREKLATYKLRAEMMTKLLDLQERAKVIKQISDFQKYIYSILTEEQKAKVVADFGD